MLTFTWPTEPQIAAIKGAVPCDERAKDVLDGWWLVAVSDAFNPPYCPDELLGIYLVGIARSRGRIICTSQVIAMDLGAARARTASGSLYLLGEMADTPLTEPVMLGLVRHFLG